MKDNINTNKAKKVLTLCVVHNDVHILLGMKKRGFGEGKWSGFGGKVLEGETAEEGAVRELKEKSGITALSLEKKGVLHFIFEENPEALEVHIFAVFEYEGEHEETEEMIPQWFIHNEIPFDEMWEDGKYWLPVLLDGKSFYGKFYFLNDGGLFDFELNEVENFNDA